MTVAQPIREPWHENVGWNPSDGFGALLAQPGRTARPGGMPQHARLKDEFNLSFAEPRARGS
jgi:hypothetical protein